MYCRTSTKDVRACNSSLQVQVPPRLDGPRIDYRLDDGTGSRLPTQQLRPHLLTAAT